LLKIEEFWMTRTGALGIKTFLGIIFIFPQQKRFRSDLGWLLKILGNELDYRRNSEVRSSQHDQCPTTWWFGIEQMTEWSNFKLISWWWIWQHLSGTEVNPSNFSGYSVDETRRLVSVAANRHKTKRDRKWEIELEMSLKLVAFETLLLFIHSCLISCICRHLHIYTDSPFWRLPILWKGQIAATSSWDGQK
jgi:hypothetical protein